ncbi:MAG: ATP-binding protein [Spirochaetales bacterium]|nr:ATP-binding protein [Spirochaetales bacterium]
MYYERKYSDKIHNLVRFFPVVTICGARQTGKTTLIKKTFPGYNYVSLDLPSTAAMAENNPDEFFRSYRTPLIIDEVQYAPALFRHLKRKVDDNRHNMGRYILTGSQKFNLMKEVSDSLAGRSVILDLENLSWQEIRKKNDSILSGESLIKLITRGQFPELWRVPDLPAASFYSSYLATYLERDVRQILNVVSLRDFERFIRALAPRSGQILNKSDLARDVGVSVKAINDWISVLQASNQIVLLEPWYSNISKRMAKSPKIYFCDSGLLCYLLGVNAENYTVSPFKGQIWETLVYAELRKINQTADNPVTFWFYRDQAAREIDFILEKGGFLNFAECKWTENPDKSDIKTMTVIAGELAAKGTAHKPGKHSLICNTGQPFSISDSMMAVNISHLEQLVL